MKVQIANGRWETPVGVVLIRTSKKTGRQYASTFAGRKSYKYFGNKREWIEWTFVPGLFEKLQREPEHLRWLGNRDVKTPTPFYKEEQRAF